MENFGFDVADTARLMRRDFDRRAAALGVTRAQWRVLSRLSRRDGQRQVDLADALDLEPITLCRIVDRLEEARLVERRRDDSDRRAWNVCLTPTARPLISELQALGQAFHEEALAGVSVEEKEAVRQVLARVRENLAKPQAVSGRRAS
ncbi:MAG: MarR family transcriptional regulator [Pseudomonadota bacterium]|nr:MarR family transcriptional regulator [Pseudomonadota bacterium]